LMIVDEACVGFAPGFGNVVTGVLAAGGRTGSGRLGASGGVCCWIAFPPIEVIPPFCGPGAPPPSDIVITERGSAAGRVNSRPDVNASAVSRIA
jgi:hypothetical protein